MDRDQFDTIARLISTGQTRRAAVGLLLGAALLGRGHDSAAARRKPKKRKGEKPNPSGPCYPGRTCIPGPGRDNAGCDFSVSSLFRRRNASGSQLSGANFRGADLSEADLQGADLGGACLVGASLEGAKLDGADLDGAIFCNTTMPDGSVNDSGCGQTTPCCPPLEDDCPTVDVSCYLTDDQNVCQQPINGFPSVGHCGRGLACCPCGHPDVDYWTNLCNTTYPACQNTCKAVDGGTFLECWSGCIL